MDNSIQEILLGGYRLAVDAEKTRAYYAAHPEPWVTCTCGGCRNFVQAVKFLPEEAKTLFARLGIDPEKPAETSWFPGTKTQSNGAAWYHLCGTIVERVEPGENYRLWEWLDIAEKFRAALNLSATSCGRISPSPAFRWT